MSGWTSADKPPKENEIVQVITENGCVYAGYYAGGHRYYTANNYLCDAWTREPDVVAWKPLDSGEDYSESPDVPAKWEYDEEATSAPRFRCTNCGGHAHDVSAFCPNCGKYMHLGLREDAEC